MLTYWPAENARRFVSEQFRSHAAPQTVCRSHDCENARKFTFANKATITAATRIVRRVRSTRSPAPLEYLLSATKSVHRTIAPPANIVLNGTMQSAETSRSAMLMMSVMAACCYGCTHVTKCVVPPSILIIATGLIGSRSGPIVIVPDTPP